MVLSLITGPTVEPVTLEDAKAWCRVDSDDEIVTLDLLIAAARQRAEALTGRQLLSATYRLVCEGFRDVFELPRPPLIAVDSITYVDTAGATQTVSTSVYQVLAPTGPFAGRGVVRPAYAQNWPVARSETLAAVTIEYRAGYGTLDNSVPADIRSAILMMVEAWYGEGRGDLTTTGVQASPIGAIRTLVPYRVD